MSTFKAYFSEDFSHELIGEITGTSAYALFPSVPGYAFKLQGRSTNLGSFMIGTNSGTLAYEVDAGFDTDWFPLVTKNLNSLYFENVSGSSERLTYWVKQ